MTRNEVAGVVKNCWLSVNWTDDPELKGLVKPRNRDFPGRERVGAHAEDRKSWSILIDGTGPSIECRLMCFQISPGLGRTLANYLCILADTGLWNEHVASGYRYIALGYL